MPPLDTDTVLREEAAAIHGVSLADQQGTALYRALNELNSAALCLSGGGIRSASFALGVIQALATHPRAEGGASVQKPEDSLLSKFHYLSTVSGGGYIGSWLSSWVTRAGFPAVWKDLVGRPMGPDIEPPVIGWLRSYSNYLTPKLGFMSPDFWSAMAIIARNLLVNWLIILPVFCIALLALKEFVSAVAWFSQFDPRTCSRWYFAAVAAGCISLFFALFFTTRNRPTLGASNAGQTAFLWKALVPVSLSAVFFTFPLASPCAYNYLLTRQMPLFSLRESSIFGLGIAGCIVIYFFSWIVALPKCGNWKNCMGDLVAWLVGGTIYGALMSLGVYSYLTVSQEGVWWFSPAEILLIVFAIPWALASHLLAEMIFVAVGSYRSNSEFDSEWLARAEGWYLLAFFVWSVVMFIIFLVYVAGPILENAYKDVRVWLLLAGSGAVAAGLAASTNPPVQGVLARIIRLSKKIILLTAALIFALVLTVLISTSLDRLIFGGPLIRIANFKATVPLDSFPNWPGGGWPAVAVIILVFVGASASFWVNINQFSLHGLYRNRLTRAFLGASRSEGRQPNTFTDFDVGDDPKVHELLLPNDARGPQRALGPNWRPFQIINIALNIVSTKRLAWQERKAQSFTVSPLHAGTAYGGMMRGSDGVLRASGAYRPSRDYAGGMSLGTAFAISGAAASPNMGYNSSRLLALLMTLFNARLGAWFGNPASNDKKIYGSKGPRWAIIALLNEMFGQTTADANYVYLSDGGHFENLGLYEMVRRRCRYIVISDAGCDPNFAFEDLGNAARKISLDLGVPITIRRLHAYKIPASNVAYFAVGEIDYPAADSSKEKGFLIYIKPGHYAEASAGVLAYAATNPTFPHESTTNQFFTESQFESYRSLGFEITDGLLTAAKKASPPWDGSLKGLFETVGKM
jgi:hypothetical protein